MSESFKQTILKYITDNSAHHPSEEKILSGLLSTVLDSEKSLLNMLLKELVLEKK
ncbi:MAG: hypothetical protein ABH832_00300 [bacterium]